jgi:hypothetical protein
VSDRVLNERDDDDPMTGYQEMGEGHIPAARLGEEIRPLRHNVRQLIAGQHAHTMLIREALNQAGEAKSEAGAAARAVQQANEKADNAMAKVIAVDRDMWGDPNRPDHPSFARRIDSRFAEMAAMIRSQSTQNKWIIGLLVSVVLAILGLCGVLLTVLHHP